MRRHIYRSAITGRIITAKYGKTHPDTTVKEKLHPTNKERTQSLAEKKDKYEKWLSCRPDPENRARLKKNQEIINKELRATGKL